jgi:hypothetical protein
MNINYCKRKNTDLFKSLEKPNTLFLSNLQNYIPIYQRIFSLNESNYNNVNLNNLWHILNIDNEKNIYECKIKNSITNKIKSSNLFFKMAPLLDPYKYLIGKYTLDEKLLNLPQLNSTEENCNSKFLNTNNSAYVDGLFVYLTSNLMQSHNFIHGIDYYGSFLGIKNDFIFNVYDDIDYLNNSEFFNKQKNILFKIDNYDHLFKNESLIPITIEHNITSNSTLSIKSINNDIFENIFQEEDKLEEESNIVNLEDLKELSIDLSNSNILNLDKSNLNMNSLILNSNTNSTCSSRTSYTSKNCENCGNSDCENCENNECENCECENCECENCEGENCKCENCKCANKDDDKDEMDDVTEYTDETTSKTDDDDDDDEKIDVTIHKFPVQVICMEHCENTFDDLILSTTLKTEEWHSAFMQIIMILIVYQKAFNFTHNDLHTNNVMYNSTNEKYIYYCYKKKYYKVPTFGRIYKIIDFGRSIYKLNGNLYCSDSFQIGNDAATQYNIEPFFNNSKPRLEPNYSFDLCRLACSIFDYVIEDFEEIKDLSKCDPIKRLIVEWCLDDKGINMLYKNNKTDRYPEFKLYKMIARCVHNHTPQVQLDRPEFDKYSKFKGKVPLNTNVINIDDIPSYV